MRQGINLDFAVRDGLLDRLGASECGLKQEMSKLYSRPRWSKSGLTCPSMFIEQLPQMPSRHDLLRRKGHKELSKAPPRGTNLIRLTTYLLNERVGSCSFLIFRSASRTIGEHSVTSTL